MNLSLKDRLKLGPDNYNRFICFPIVFLFFIFPGCIAVNSHLKGIEPNAKPMPAINYTKISDEEIMRSSFRLFWFIPVTPLPNIIDAINDTILNKGGDNLIEMQTWHERQYWILGTVDIIRVKGSIIKYNND